YSFLLSYKSGDTSYIRSLWNLTKTNSSVSETETMLFGFSQFSPCGDLLMVVSQAALDARTSDFVRFLFTSNSQSYQSNLNLTLSQGPTAPVVAKADGSREIELTGMSKTTIASPQCDIAITAHSPVDIVLIDARAHRTGLDTVTGGSVNEIPGGTYTGVG